MRNILAVFGPTGQQGASVVESVINDPVLSEKFQVRAITRDISKPAAQALISKGVEVVAGDLDDAQSIFRALAGVHTVFGMTAAFLHLPNGKDKEVAHGKTIADASVAAGVERLIFSSLPSVSELSGGVLTEASHFESKVEIEKYIRSLSEQGKIKAAFFSLGSFMQNFQSSIPGFPPMRSSKTDEFEVTNIANPDTPLPVIDIDSDAGKFICTILADPELYEGKTLYGAENFYTYSEICELMSKAAGKKIVYNQIADEDFKNSLPSFLQGPLLQIFQCLRDYGYYGPQQDELVAWSAKQARGRLTTLEEYFRKTPLNL